MPTHYVALRDKLLPLLVSGTSDTTPLNLNCNDSDLFMKCIRYHLHKIQRTSPNRGPHELRERVGRGETAATLTNEGEFIVASQFRRRSGGNLLRSTWTNKAS